MARQVRRVAAGVVLVMPMSAWATVQNTRTSQNYATITQAINNAISGDTLAVGPGTYNERVDVDKSLTIIGGGSTGANQVIIQWDGAGNAVVNVDLGVALDLRGVKVVGVGNSGLWATLSSGVALDDVWVDGTSTLGQGGGIRLDNTDAQLTDVLISGAGASSEGGAIFLTSSSSATALLTNVQVTGATSGGNGAGIFASSVDVSCTPCLVDGAVATGDGGGIYGTGGSLVSVGSTWDGNSASGDGGGIYWTNGLVDLQGDVITGNDGANGGGVYLGTATDFAGSDLRVTGNSAATRGGGVRAVTPAAFAVRRALVCDNDAGFAGGIGIDAAITSSVRNVSFVENTGTAALRVEGVGPLEARNNTFAGNTASSGALEVFNGAAATAVNNVFAFTQSGAGADLGASASLTTQYNWFYSNAAGSLTGGGTLDFTDSEAIDPELRSYLPDGNCLNDDLWPAYTSPLIDGGLIPITDPDGSRADIGAFGGPDSDVAPHTDGDGDGVTAVKDCDDTRMAIYPGATEVCDTIDNDCNGTPDDNAVDAPRWFPDTDDDGFGDDTATAIRSCAAPPSPPTWVNNNLDCDDGLVGTNPYADEFCDAVDHNCDGDVLAGAIDAQLWYPDVDMDGYGDELLGTLGCAQEFPGLINVGDDCDDTQPLVNPGQADQLCDDIDQDCDGEESHLDAVPYYPDADGDLHGDAGSAGIPGCGIDVGTRVPNNTDCNDSDPAVHADQPEVCDFRDTNCDGAVDNGTPLTSWWPDRDEDGFGKDGAEITSFCPPDPAWAQQGGDCDDDEAAIFGGNTEICDGLDNDCDGLTDADDPDAVGLLEAFEDFDGDGYGLGAPVFVCDLVGYATNADDCNDGNADISPDAAEVIDNDVDEDCDGIEQRSGNTDTPPGDDPSGCGCSQGGAVPWVGFPTWVLVLALRRRS